MNGSIEIKRIDPGNSSEMKDFLNFPLFLYGNNAKTKNGIARTRQLVAAGINHIFLLARKDGHIVGRMAVGCKEDILDQDGTPYGQIGLFEAIEDYQVFSAMIDFAKGLLKDKNRYLLFPFFISTWYPYRFISKGLDSFEFYLETDNKDYYAKFATQYGVDETFLYRSYLNTIDDFLERNKKLYDGIAESGLTIRHFNKSDARNELRIVYDISTQIFKENPFYTDIPFEKFLDFNLPSIRYLDENFFLIGHNEEGKPIGFLFCSPDYTGLFNSMYLYSLPGKVRFLLNKNRVKGLICKTAGLFSEYRARGIGSAAAYMVGMHAKKLNYQYVIIALVHSQNVSSLISSPKRIEKEYELYKIAVSR